MEREIGSVCRAKAVEYADAQDSGTLEKYKPNVTVEDIEEILGIEKYDEEIAEKTSRPGIVTGLVAYSTGGNGSILFIEVADMPGSGSVQLTGKLGDVLKESVEVALSWVKAHAYELGLTHDPSENIMKNRSIHVHCPSGAIPKDGPSAGLAHTVALISLFSGKAVPPTLAMTGEISLVRILWHLLFVERLLTIDVAWAGDARGWYQGETHWCSTGWCQDCAPACPEQKRCQRLASRSEGWS